MPMLKDVILPATDLDDESQQPPADGETNATTPNQQSTLLVLFETLFEMCTIGL
jgi:hypothetical protein